MTTDASLRYSCADYRGAEVAFGFCEAGGRVLARLEGTTPRGHSGNKCDLAQEANAGYCSCCAIPTHVTLPPSSDLGKVGDLEAQGVALVNDFGPSGARRLAARRWPFPSCLGSDGISSPYEYSESTYAGSGA